MNIKKNIFYLLLLVMMFVFVSCDGETCNHTYNDEYAVDSSSHSKSCNNCGEMLSENHIFTPWTIIEKASYTSTGKRTRECSVCGYLEEQVIPMISHTETYGDYTIVEDDNVSNKFYLIRTCIYCNKEEKTEYILDDEIYMLYNLTKVNKYKITLENINISYEDINYIVDNCEIDFEVIYDDYLILDGTYTIEDSTKTFKIDNEYIYLGSDKNLLSEYKINNGSETYSLYDLYCIANDNYDYYYNQLKLDIILNQNDIISVFNNLFSLNETSYTLNFDYLNDFDEYLANTTVKELVDSSYKDGTYNTIKSTLPLLKTTKISTILSYLDQYEIDIDEVINVLDSVYFLINKEDKHFTNLITSYLNIELNDMTFSEYFNQNSISNLTLNKYLLNLGFEQSEINNFISTIQKTMSTIKDYNIYQAICYLSNYSNYDDFICKKDGYLDSIKNNLSIRINLSDNTISSIVLSYSNEAISSVILYPSN